MDYQLIGRAGPEDLAVAVNKAITDGASVIGSPIQASNGNWYQAVGPAPAGGGGSVSVDDLSDATAFSKAFLQNANAPVWVATHAAGSKPENLSEAPTASDFNDLLDKLSAANLFTDVA